MMSLSFLFLPLLFHFLSHSILCFCRPTSNPLLPMDKQISNCFGGLPWSLFCLIPHCDFKKSSLAWQMRTITLNKPLYWNSANQRSGTMFSLSPKLQASVKDRSPSINPAYYCYHLKIVEYPSQHNRMLWKDLPTIQPQ